MPVQSPIYNQFLFRFFGLYSARNSTRKLNVERRFAFRTGEGLGWHQHDAGIFRATEIFFRPGYAANLVDSWIPALDGVEEKLKAGAKVADIGCGLGASTVLMAQAYPNSTFSGFDYHDQSIDNHGSRSWIGKNFGQKGVARCATDNVRRFYAAPQQIG